MCSYSGQQCFVKDVSSIFYFEKESSLSSKGAGYRTHTQELWILYFSATLKLSVLLIASPMLHSTVTLPVRCYSV